jgi:hypothetical protein
MESTFNTTRVHSTYSVTSKQPRIVSGEILLVKEQTAIPKILENKYQKARALDGNQRRNTAEVVKGWTWLQ